MMKKNKGLLIFALMVALVVGYATYDYFAEEKAEKKKVEESYILSMKADQIKELEVSKEGLKVRLQKEKDKDVWNILEPQKDIADQKVVRDYLEDLLKEKSTLVLEDEAAEGAEGKASAYKFDFKIYGLDQPAGQIVLLNNQDQKTTLYVSKQKNFEGEVYLKRNEERKALLANSSWAQKIEKSFYDFREKRILRHLALDITNFKIQKGKETNDFSFKDFKWTSPNKSNWKLDQQKVKDFVVSLAGISALEYVKEGNYKLSAKEMNQYGLNSPLLKLEVTLKEGRPWKALLSAVEEKPEKTDKANKANKDDKSKKAEEQSSNKSYIYYVQVQEPSFLMKISTVDAEKLSKFNLDDYRDRKEAFQLKKEDVKKLEIRIGANIYELEEKNANWDFTFPHPDLEIAQDKVKDLISKVESLEVLEFLPLKTSFSTKEIREILYKGTDGKVLLHLTFADVQKRKVKDAEKSFYLAKSSLIPESFSVEESLVKSLSLSEILKKKELKKEELKKEEPKKETNNK